MTKHIHQGKTTNTILNHTILLNQTYKDKTGKDLMVGVDDTISAQHTALADGDAGQQHTQHALFHAPFCCCSHDGEDTFNYGNKAALALFEMEWADFVGMKSLKSAAHTADEEDQATQAERRALLDNAAKEGLITNYSGVRVSSKGNMFRIEDATVWTMNNNEGLKIGQAVRFDRVVRLHADGSDAEALRVDTTGNWSPLTTEVAQVDNTDGNTDTEPNLEPEPELLQLPPTDTSQHQHQQQVEVGGGAVALDALGPVVVNVDGTVSRITNWASMHPSEQEATTRIIGKRNQERMATLLAAQGDV